MKTKPVQKEKPFDVVSADRVPMYSLYNPRTKRFIQWHTGKFNLKCPRELFTIKEVKGEAKLHKDCCIVSVKVKYAIEIFNENNQ